MSGREILVFGGTAEGRQVSDYLIGCGVPHTVCVATEYGEEVLAPHGLRTVHRGRMDQAAMQRFICGDRFAVAVDATHPYAVEVSENIRQACGATGLPYLRCLRPKDDVIGGQPQCIYVNTAAEAADYLEWQTGRILLTTGSKELAVFTGRITDLSRLFARVLPSAEVIASCRALGLEGRQIIAMQGPFSEEMNEAMLRQTQAAFLVTKDTGKSGGFPEKVEAVRRLGIKAVVLRRPEESGYSWEELRELLAGYIGAGRTGEAMRAEDSEHTDNPGQTDEPKHAGESEQTNESEYAGEPVRAEGSEQADGPGQTGEDEPACAAETDSAEPVCERAICCIGIGMGAPGTLTIDAAREIEAADILFGAKRILESVRGLFEPCGSVEMPQEMPRACSRDEQNLPRACTRDEQELPGSSDGSADAVGRRRPPMCVAEYDGRRIAEYLAAHPEYRRIAILVSGDVGFYSGARGLQDAFPGERITYHCGISSVVYFASRIPTAWQDAKLLSMHGKKLAILNYVRRYPRIFLLVSGRTDVMRVCGELVRAGLTRVRVTLGTNLSYPEESVRSGTPEEFLDGVEEGLHVLLLENPDAGHVVAPGIPDERFVRGKVPMTKEEVRILSVAKLQLHENVVVWDVGAGTGSVSMEIARLCTGGTVYAVERNPEAIALIRENSRKLCLSNVIPVEGTAPQALEILPAPTHAFIGGSSGKMREILEVVREKNPQARVVINTVTLESLAEVTGLLREFGGEDADIVQISAAKARMLGRYHLMDAMNPVYIISFGGPDVWRE